MATLRLPNINCPLPYRIYPESEKLEEGTISWMDKWHLYSDDKHRQRLASVGCGRLAALMYPYAANADVAQIMSDYVLWAFSFDDEYCDEGLMSEHPALSITAMLQMQRSIESPETPAYPENNFAMALRDLRLRLDKYTTRLHISRFVNAQRGYFMVEIGKLVNPQPTISDSALLRLCSGGGMVFPTFGHISTLVNISQLDMEDRRLCAMTEMAAMLIVWESDFFSYGKELVRDPEGRQHNIVSLIQQRTGITHEQALAKAFSMRDNIAGLYMRMRDYLLAHASPEIKAYVQSLDCYWRGGLEWIIENPRYRYMNGIDGPTAYDGGALTEALPDNCREKVDISSIFWWWHYDPAHSAPTKNIGTL
ncbi:terpene synthase [Pseudomonas salmasensis]|uniref:Terpene synthase n=1 Tax=Pseudomonas salmasensis TaxID=2745514 RepID=A0ABU5FFV3_9PSED|nr:terpene synthase [Pseudomonas salmasensis]MDY4300632.1 terpene synthase [Pseudomonas salmasensis]